MSIRGQPFVNKNPELVNVNITQLCTEKGYIIFLYVSTDAYTGMMMMIIIITGKRRGRRALVGLSPRHHFEEPPPWSSSEMHLPSRFKRRGPQFKMSGPTTKRRKDTYEPSQPSDCEKSPEIFSPEWQGCGTHGTLVVLRLQPPDFALRLPPPDLRLPPPCVGKPAEAL